MSDSRPTDETRVVTFQVFGTFDNQNVFRKQNQILSHSNLFNLKTCKFKIQVPNNAAVQIYDYKSKHSRVVFGPDLVMLQPNEEFTQLSLSGGKPKRPNLIRSVALLLGPDYTSDIITVETSDHACLQLQLSYHWHFEVRYLLNHRWFLSEESFIGEKADLFEM